MIFIRLFGFRCIYLHLFNVYVGFLTGFPPTKLDSATFPWIITLGSECQVELVSGVFAQLVLAMVFKTIGGFEQSSQWVQFPYIPALQSALDTELRTSKGISICHGLTRNYTEKTEAETRKEEQTEAEN